MYLEIERCTEALRTYITSTYHISNPALVALRDELLEAPGAIAQRPIIETTARYKTSRKYEELAINHEVREFLGQIAEQGVLFNPPYNHQATALEAALNHKKDLVVTTGTGSGKTETFLLPVLGRMAEEALMGKGRTFTTRAVRALLLYPMNALVNDQLGRLRLLFGGNAVSGWFTEKAGRPMKFARYTGRTLYPGSRREDVDEHRERLKSIKDFYIALEDQAVGDVEAAELIKELKVRGKWPAKPSSVDVEDGVSSWFGSGDWKRDGEWVRAVERPEDPELFLRHEVQDKVPDLLVTNYSMLEYMLLRPIERRIFQETAGFFQAHPEQRFMLILDEAHLYRGAQGTEVAMLIRRLKQRLQLRQDQLQVICTSASFSNPEAARVFTAQLTGKPYDGVEVITGEKRAHEPSGQGGREFAEVLRAVDLKATRSEDLVQRVLAVWPLLCNFTEFNGELSLSGAAEAIVELEVLTRDKRREWREYICSSEPEQLGEEVLAVIGAKAEGAVMISHRGEQEMEVVGGEVKLTGSSDPCARLLYHYLSALPVTGRLLNLTSGAPSEEDEYCQGGGSPAQELNKLAEKLFPNVEVDVALGATNALVELASMARVGAGAPLLAARVHLFYRGLPGLWACADQNCSKISGSPIIA